MYPVTPNFMTVLGKIAALSQFKLLAPGFDWHLCCLSYDQIRIVAFSIVLRQYAFPALKRLCFQTKNLSTDGKQVYEIKYI